MFKSRVLTNSTAIIELYTLFPTKTLNVRKMVLATPLLGWAGLAHWDRGRGGAGPPHATGCLWGAVCPTRCKVR